MTGQLSKKAQKEQDEALRQYNEGYERFKQAQGPQDVGELPQIISDRMLKRIGVTAGIPIAIGTLFFPVFYYLKTVADIDVPVWVVYIFSTLAWAGGLAGISYGASGMSAICTLE